MSSIQVDARRQLTHGKHGNVFVLEFRLHTAYGRWIGVECGGRGIGAKGWGPAECSNGVGDEGHQTGYEHNGGDGEEEHLEIGPRVA